MELEEIEETEETESQIFRRERSNQLQNYLFWIIPPCLVLLFLVILLAAVIHPREPHSHIIGQHPFPVQLKPDGRSVFKSRKLDTDIPLELVTIEYNATEAESYCRNKFKSTLVMPRTDRQWKLLMISLFSLHVMHSCPAFYIGIRRIVSHDVSHHRDFYFSSKSRLNPINVPQSCSALKYSESSWEGIEVSCKTKSSCFLCQTNLECISPGYCYESVKFEEEVGFINAEIICKNLTAGQLAIISKKTDFSNIVWYLTNDIHDASCKNESIHILIGNRYQSGFETFHETSVELSVLKGITKKLWENCVVIEGRSPNQTKMVPCEEKVCSICWSSGNEEHITPVT